MKVVLDIETIPCSENTRSLLPEIPPPANLKDEDKINEWKEQALPHLIEQQYRNTALDAAFGRIFCISLIPVKEDFSFGDASVIFGEDEAKILSSFWDEMRVFGKPSFVTHNGLSFDLPFILKRSIVNQIKPTMDFKLSRYRTDFVYDTMAVWSNWEARNAIKLDTLSSVLGMGNKNMTGAEVYDLWTNKKYLEIAEYCLQDTYLTYACYCRMNFLKVFPFSDLKVNFMEQNTFED